MKRVRVLACVLSLSAGHLAIAQEAKPEPAIPQDQAPEPALSEEEVRRRREEHQQRVAAKRSGLNGSASHGE